MSFWCHRFNQNSNENIVRISALKFFVSSWGLPGSFFGHPGNLVSKVIYKEAYEKSQKAFRKPQGSYKKFQGRNPYNIFVGFLVEMMTLKRHFEINWPLEKNEKIMLLQNQFQPIVTKVHTLSFNRQNAVKSCNWYLIQYLYNTDILYHLFE